MQTKLGALTCGTRVGAPLGIQTTGPAPNPWSRIN